MAFLCVFLRLVLRLVGVLRRVVQGRVFRLDLIAQLLTVLQGLGCQRDLLELVKLFFSRILPFPPTSNVGKGGCGFFDSTLACFEEGCLLILA